MKTRKQIIDEVLAKNRVHSPVRQDATLEFALLGMQDALLFDLANQLGISIVEEAVRS